MRSKTQPFRVICKLQDGRFNSADGILMLDCILYHAWFLKYEPEVLQGTKKSENPKHFGLPLRKFENGRYAASCGFYHQIDQHIEYWNKRNDHLKHSDLNTAKGKIDTGAGEYKAYRIPQIIRITSQIEFYGYGTVEKVKDLLSYIPAVGKKPAAGWGLIKEWIVEPQKEDWSTTGPYGLMRPMPVEEYTPDRDYMVMDYAIKPPAWKPGNDALCYIPEVRI